MWFKDLVGFEETTPENARSKLSIEDRYLVSHITGGRYHIGTLSTPSLAELRQHASALACGEPIELSEIVSDITRLHTDPENAGALFQVASQFNLLEMVSPNVTPEQGVGLYDHDHTQGPACAIACGAGTIYRNYFVPVGEQIGQTATTQIDCLRDLGEMLGNDDGHLWTMRNGYALPSSDGLQEIDKVLSSGDDEVRDQLKSALRIGIMEDTQVTLGEANHLVTQAYCSALPVAYANLPTWLWERFARLILEASYEATLHAAVLNRDRTGNKTVFLTLLGGGAFGNKTSWIIDSIELALSKFQDSGLDIQFVSYGISNPALAKLIQSTGSVLY